MTHRSIQKVAFLSMHTSPLDQPGVGDAGGMNVYMDGLASSLARQGVEVTVFVRRVTPDVPDVVAAERGYQVVSITAGPVQPLPIRALPDWVDEYALQVIEHMRGGGFDLVHSHYWLSGWAGLIVKKTLGLPLANSFHTLGRVKEAARRSDDPPEPLARIAAEKDVIASADCVVVSSDLEADILIGHYQADPERLCVNPPGVDLDLFQPGSLSQARQQLGITADPLVLFVGRIQPLKGVGIAVQAMVTVREVFPEAGLALVGGPSGPAGEYELARVRHMTELLGLTEAVSFYGPRPRNSLPVFYQAADVLMVPSRSETFGLVAVEGQATGLPVVAANVGGLSHVVSDRHSGILVDGRDPVAYGKALLEIMESSHIRDEFSAGARSVAARFSWEISTRRLLELYQGIIGGHG